MRRPSQTIGLGLLSGGMGGAASALLVFWPEGLVTGLPTGLFLAALAAALTLFLAPRPRRRRPGGILNQESGRR